MNNKLKYFILNNAYEFRRGKAENMTVDGDCLRFESEGLSGLGKYLTRVFDSGERGTIWHRLLINTENCQASELRVTVYAADELDFMFDGRDYDVDGVIHDESIPLNKKLELFEAFEKKQVKGAADALLHEVEGRYLWIYTEVFAVSDKPATIKDIRIYLPAARADRRPKQPKPKRFSTADPTSLSVSMKTSKKPTPFKKNSASPSSP